MAKDTGFEKLSIEDALARLKVDAARGLSDDEARQRQERYGFNEIPEKEETLLARIAKRFWGPIPWMIEAAAVLSALVQKWEDFTIIVILLLVNVVIDFRQEASALLAEAWDNTAVVLPNSAVPDQSAASFLQELFTGRARFSLARGEGHSVDLPVAGILREFPIALLFL